MKTYAFHRDSAAFGEKICILYMMFGRNPPLEKRIYQGMGFFSTGVWTRGRIHPLFIQRHKARQAMGLEGFSTVSTASTTITG